MVESYKNLVDRKIAVPISISLKLIGEIEQSAADLDKNRSELINALIRYFLENKKDKDFVKKIMELTK